jgi:Mn-containing catalase
MVKAANASQLSRIFERHLAETDGQIERLNGALKMIGGPVRAKPCKGMMGLIEEGEEVMEEGKKLDPAASDLSLIAAAQKIEHYEISAYLSARNLAQQLQNPELAGLLQASLAEEQNADQLLNQLARPLLTVSRMPAPVD